MVGGPNTALTQLHTQIMWSRLIAVVEEQAQTLVRTAFSTSVREAGDLSAGVFDGRGRMLAQAVTGTPGHVNSMANAVAHFLDTYPLAAMRPGARIRGPAIIIEDETSTVVSPAFNAVVNGFGYIELIRNQ